MNYTSINTLFADNAAALNAAEAHGIAVGMLCVNSESATNAWLDEVFRDRDTITPEGRELLTALYEHTRRQLREDDSEFDLLLPDDNVSLEQRAEALRDWCQGFLFGIGYSRAEGDWPGESGEILRDILEISRLDTAAEGEEDENAFMEVHEYLRAAVLLLQQELNTQPIKQTHH